MVNELIQAKDNIYIIDAPAGSGKTYSIRKQILTFEKSNPNTHILAITFTNRAANELKNNVLDSNVDISTIHSFVSGLISPFFKLKAVINLYLELYESKINEKLKDVSNNNKTNQKFLTIYGQLDFETIREQLYIHGLYYNQRQFSSFYYGGLSHNDLLQFFSCLLSRFPKIYEKIKSRYKLVIVDEYQDTPEVVLTSFITAASSGAFELFFYGDSMQQIYQSYSKVLKDYVRMYSINNTIPVNYRSNKNIINVLNKIYAKDGPLQEIPNEIKIKDSDFTPRVLLINSEKIENTINQLVSSNPNTLVLYLFNRERFIRLGAGQLFDGFNRMPKYGFSSTIKATEVLLETDVENNPDDLVTFLLVVYNAEKLFKVRKYGQLIKFLKEHRNLFNNTFDVHQKSDKLRIIELLRLAFQEIKLTKITIGELISYYVQINIINHDFANEIIEDDDYKKILEIPIDEFWNLQSQVTNVSTQHGVKGESHDSVIFVAEDSLKYQPFINMTEFFRLWSEEILDFKIESLDSFIYQLQTEIENDFSLDKTFKENKIFYCEKAKNIKEKFKDNVYFNLLYEKKYSNFIDSPTNKSFKLIKNTYLAERTLSAFKLFYVGCSRARRNLTIIVDENKIKDFKKSFVAKLNNVGFDVIDSETL
ncbi:UvrD-helicase domain-containing protein [Leuconostoc mesenteroides]|uniref:UvrD-helicase domain-containing protein n=1 Tax=Leuconostoc mesenteroides TaxID=1245 RepID=UPI001238BC19|nr:UvrD-helicase domain-containing protein [Leuconostoc mesenteroides]KAA8347094.1 ATP-dependent helicase [Leuconostoc mesenteroides]